MSQTVSAYFPNVSQAEQALAEIKDKYPNEVTVIMKNTSGQPASMNNTGNMSSNFSNSLNTFQSQLTNFGAQTGAMIGNLAGSALSSGMSVLPMILMAPITPFLMMTGQMGRTNNFTGSDSNNQNEIFLTLHSNSGNDISKVEDIFKNHGAQNLKQMYNN